MDLCVSEFPATVTPRRRTVKFETADLAHILADYCRVHGVAISEECKLNVWEIECDVHGNDFVTLCIDGD